MTWQPWVVTWTEPARATLRRLDRPTAGRLVAAVDRYAATGTGDVKPIKSAPGEWRLRVGGWRVIFARYQGSKPEDRRLLVLAARPRGGAYQD